MNAAEGLAAVRGRAAAAYARWFGDESLTGVMLAAAPGRINIIGEHTDYSGGMALPMAINRWCVAAVGRAEDARNCGLASDDLGEVVRLDLSGALERSAVPRGSWACYAAGVIAEFQRVLVERGAELPAVHIAVAGSVPLGAGLASSAALEVAVATGLEGICDVQLDPMDKAQLCRRAEHQWAGVRCGLMDQWTAASARERSALWLDFAKLAAEPVRLPRGVSFVVANSGVRHALVGSEYAARVEACERARHLLRRVHLGQASPRSVEVHGRRGRLDPEAWRCARHVAMENLRVVEAVGALRGGDGPRLGDLMNRSHASLRDDYRVSCAELDALVEIAVGPGVAAGDAGPAGPGGVPGVWGARMTGGGFGGCVIAAVAEGTAPVLMERWRDEYPRRMGRECDVFEVQAAGGAVVLRDIRGGAP